MARITSWLVPGAILTLMPKCPVCLAAYLALGTGIGLSIPAAARLRVCALALSGALLAVLALLTAMRFRAARAQRH